MAFPQQFLASTVETALVILVDPRTNCGQGFALF
jgi:hypothetical protein